MKDIIKSPTKNIDILVIFILSVFMSLPYIAEICSGYLSLESFIIQEFLLWNYTSINKILPFKDVFYPYGILNYFKNYNILLELLYFLISPFLFTTLYFLLKKIFKSRIILYTSFFLFYIFILYFVGFSTFSRYGLLVIFSLFLSYYFYYHNKIKPRNLFLLGAALGLFFSLINDIGTYVVFFFIFIFLLKKLIKIKKRYLISTNLFLNIIKETKFVVLGFLTGNIPFLAFLFIQRIPYALFNYFIDVKEMAIVAKTPFFTFIDSPANVFTILILYFALFYNFIKLFFFKRNYTLLSFFQISLIFDILIMEQKSIIRSIDKQITFVSLILLMFLLYELLNYFKINMKSKIIIYILSLVSIIAIYGANIDRQKVDLYKLSKNYYFFVKNKSFENNLASFLDNNPSYLEIINSLKKQKDFNNKVFSFPTGNSVFYILLNQKPPYYNSTVEGSSYTKQNSTIKYIQENKIKYILLNTRKDVLHDSVPDYIRQSSLFSYILTSYFPITQIGDHIILRRENNKDFFVSDILEQKREYRNNLLQVNLSKIPYSEGFYKFNYLQKYNTLLFEANNAQKINLFFKEKNFNSKNKLFVFMPKDSENPSHSVTFELKNGVSTSINYQCKNNIPCIINLSRVPLFYNDRLIKKIILDKQFKGEIKIYYLKNKADLW